MILSDIKRYLMERHRASLEDIAMHFDASPDAVRGMLDHWIRKGRVTKESIDMACGDSCNKCAPATTEIYTWVGDGAGAANRCTVQFKHDCSR